MLMPIKRMILGRGHWILLLSSTTSLSGATALSGLFANIIIARTLPTPEVGAYALLLALVQLIVFLGALGQPGLMKRIYSLQPIGHFDWLADAREALFFSLPALALGILASLLIYRLPAWYTVFVASTVILLVLSHSIAELLNSQRQYIGASLLLHLPNGLMLFPALIALFIPFLARLEIMLATQFTAVIIALLLGISLLAYRSQRGNARILPGERWQGLGFGVLLVTHLIPFQGLIPIAGRMVPQDALAAYAALGVLARPFFLLQGAILQILSVELVRRRWLPHWRIEASLWGAAAILFGGAVLVLPEFASRIYTHRYDEFNGLITPLCLAGALLIPEILPRSYIAGRANLRLLNHFIAAQIFIALFGIGLAIIWGLQTGVYGIAWAGASMIGLRNIAAYGYYAFARLTGQEVESV